ncbi:FAD-dependent oxidoreductase [Nocardia fluminea]
MLYIDPDVCIDCSACVTACPVSAIVADYDLEVADLPFADINAAYYEEPSHQGYSTTPVVANKRRFELHERGPLRVAVVGSGPAAMYAAEELLTRRGLEVEVDVYERLPVPWGLVRFGVAPDHQLTKSVTKLFAKTGSRRGLFFHFNVEIGTHLTHDELLEHHHAVIYATGAPRDRRLGVPGELLEGSHSANEFVAWYNGHPDFADMSFNFGVERAVVVGTGNVALDVARVLASDIDYLTTTDMADHALEALRYSQIREVVVLGRRGPEHAAYTLSELVGLTNYDVATVPDALSSPDPKTQFLKQVAAQPKSEGRRRIVFRFLSSPLELVEHSGRVRAVRVVRNELVDGDTSPTDDVEEFDCGLVLRSIGNRGIPLSGLPFDQVLGTLPNVAGRVVDSATAEPLVGVYATGWIKRGPSGVIGTNKQCAQESVESLLADFSNGKLRVPSQGRPHLDELIGLRQPSSFGYSGWKAIDAYELKAGREGRRPRRKLVDVSTMVDVALGTCPTR